MQHLGKREITDLQVNCNNIERSCEWKGTVGTLEEHLAKCDFSPLPCPNECIDDNMNIQYIMRKDLNKHETKECPQRAHECTFGKDGDKCIEKGTYYYITQIHDKVCEQKELLCVNIGCPKVMQRQHMNKHVKYECEHTVIACKHRTIGCIRGLKRKDMPAHELDDKLHLHMAIDTITALKENNDITLKEVEAMTIRFSDFQLKKESDKKFNSPFSFYANEYHMGLQVFPNGNKLAKGTCISLYVRIVEGKYDSQLSWPFLGSITLTLLNQLEDKNHHSNRAVLGERQNLRVGRDWGYTQFIAHSALGYDPVKNTQYLKDDTLYFRVKVKVDDHKPWLECKACM